MKKAETLGEIWQATEPIPLEGETLDQFYVEADPARNPHLPPSGRLRDYLKRAPLRLLFASHPGAGKSTELSRLVRDASESFWFVRLSVREELELETITHIDLILALMEKLYEEGHKNSLIRDRRVIEPVRNWLREVVQETKLARLEELDVEAGIGFDGLLAQIVGVFTKLRSAFSLSYESAKTVRQVLQPRIGDLRLYCNQVLTEINTNLANINPSRRLVILVDDTDKLEPEAATELFVKHTGLLSDLHASVIYTVPLFLIHSPSYQRLEEYFKTLTLPMIRTYTLQGQRFDQGWDILKKIIFKRINVDTLIDPEALDLVIDKTGGVLRDFLRVVDRASQVAQYQRAERISVEAMRYGLDELKGEYSQKIYGTEKLTADVLYKKMIAITKSPLGHVPSDEALRLLLYTKAVIEYNISGNRWYTLHPLMQENLYDMGYLP